MKKFDKKKLCEMLLQHLKISIPLALLCTLNSCTSLYAYMLVLSTEYDGNSVITKEPAVTVYLEHILKFPEQFSIKAYHRKAISYKVKKTDTTTHSFYAIYDINGNYRTLSFSATGKLATSQGAWAMDTDTDIVSYKNYTIGNNIWSVEEIVTDHGIDTILTKENIIRKIHGGVTYYYRSQIDKNNKHDNCNTALWETLVEKGG
jgi:hypothetical protein